MSNPREQQFSIPDPAQLEAEMAPASAESSGSDNPVALVLDRHRDRLMSMDGVVMVGEGADELGRPAIVVGVKERHHLKAVPRNVEGVPVIVSVIGEVDALKGAPRRR